MREVGNELVVFVCAKEGFKPYWYDDYNNRRLNGPNDSSARGTPTIGHGLTGNEWSKRTITEAESRAVVKRLLSGRYREPYDGYLDDLDWDVPEESRWWVISFGYNLGPMWMRVSGFETLQRGHRAKNRKAVEAAFVLYRNPGSVWELGLRRRREAEARGWAAGWARRDPYSYLRPIEAKRIKRLVQVRKEAAAGGWTPARIAKANAYKVYLRSVVRAIKVMSKSARLKENRRERMALCRDAIAGRPIEL